MTKPLFSKFIFFCFLSSCLSGCLPEYPTENPTIQNPNPTIVIHETLPAESRELTKHPTPILKTETPPTEIVMDQSDSIHYSFEVVFNFLNQVADVKQKINFKNNSKYPISEFLLSCDTLRTDGVFFLSKTQIDGNPIDVEIGDFWLKIILPNTLETGQDLILDLTYQLILPKIPEPSGDKKPVIFGYTILQSNFVDWYPMIVPRNDEGQWILHDPWFYGEYLVYPLADFEIKLVIEDPSTEYLIAASDTPSTVDHDTYTYSYKNARNFVWSFSPSYQFSQQIIDGIAVTSYYFPFHQAAGEQVLTDVIRAIKRYADLFGAFPRNNLSIVEADFLDGMEYDGLFFLSKGFYNLYDGTPKGYLTTIAVHETAHQWWYTLIANDQALEPWLDEALCTYSEFLYYEEIYPELIDWWWQYRVDFYQPGGKINLPIYDYLGFLPYRDSTYLRGAKFFHDLRLRMGDEKFFNFLKEYVVENSNKISSANAFWTAVAKISPNDYQDIKTDFFK